MVTRTRVWGMLLALLVAAAVAAQGPTAMLTEIDQLRIENTKLFTMLRASLEEADTCRGQLAQPRAAATGQQLQEKLARLKADIEAAHPGYRLNVDTWQLEKKDDTKGR